MNKYKASIYVFDDLERTMMPIHEVMGYINTFVEHSDCKVIIIANEAEIKDDQLDDYQLRKEKVVGRTLEVQPAFDDALEYFLGEVDNSAARQFLTLHTSDIKLIYEQYELGNLRILQQTLWDFERVYSTLSDEITSNKSGMSALLFLFFPLSIEFKSGRLKVDNLQNRLHTITRQVINEEGKHKTPFAEAQDRYKNFDISDQLLSDEVLVDVLFKGLVDGTKISLSIEKSRFFADSKKIPSWKIVWYRYETDDNEVETAITTLEQDFKDRKFTLAGEILHVFGIRLSLASAELIEQNQKAVFEENKQYINDIYQRGLLEPLQFNSDDFGFESHEGLVFVEKDSEDFKELFRLTQEKRLQAETDTFPQKATALLAEMYKDSSLFYRRINYTNTPDSIYCRVPILADVKPDVFLNHFFAQSPTDQRTILFALHSRYERGDLGKDLVLEKFWFLEIANQLRKETISMSPVKKSRLEKLLELYIDPILKLQFQDVDTRVKPA